MIAAAILPLIAAKGDEKRAIALASVLALMVAAIMIVAAAAKLGFIVSLLSKPTMIGYMNGLALTILVGKLPGSCRSCSGSRSRPTALSVRSPASSRAWPTVRRLPQP